MLNFIARRICRTSRRESASADIVPTLRSIVFRRTVRNRVAEFPHVSCYHAAASCLRLRFIGGEVTCDADVFFSDDDTFLFSISSSAAFIAEIFYRLISGARYARRTLII